MNSTHTHLLLGALSFTAPLMQEYRDRWDEGGQTEAEANELIDSIRDRFAGIKETDHEGMAHLLGVPAVTYSTPSVDPIETGSFTAVSLRNYGEVGLPYFVDGVDADED